MFRAFHVTVYSNSKALVEAVIESTIEACSLNVHLLRLEEKHVRACPSRDIIHMLKHTCSDGTRGWIANEVLIDINRGTFLHVMSAALVSACLSIRPYQRDGSVVQYPCPHPPHQLRLS